ncbi:MAG TPA: SPFH domain-containing protein [Nocardioides sp.]|nr:SPFH domain-containing protein [Nocardioides sp.]
MRQAGFWWVLPLTVRRRVSVRVRNFETNRLEVNDSDGNPVEIAAIVVWQVADTARSTYVVDSYENFVSVQSEAALRHVANTHPYDDPESNETSLRGATDVVAGELTALARLAEHDVVDLDEKPKGAWSAS